MRNLVRFDHQISSTRSAAAKGSPSNYRESPANQQQASAAAGGSPSNYGESPANQQQAKRACKGLPELTRDDRSGFRDAD